MGKLKIVHSFTGILTFNSQKTCWAVCIKHTKINVLEMHAEGTEFSQAPFFLRKSCVVFSFTKASCNCCAVVVFLSPSLKKFNERDHVFLFQNLVTLRSAPLAICIV